MSSFLEAWFGPRAPCVPLVLYSRRDCGLCEVMKAEIARSSCAGRFTLREVDIDTDPRLVERFGHSIPVLEIAGRIAFKSKLTAAEFERKFERWGGEWVRAQASPRPPRTDEERC